MSNFLKKYSRGNSPLIIIIIVVAVLAVIGLVYFLWGKNYLTNQYVSPPAGSITPTTISETSSPIVSPTTSTTPGPTKSPTPTPKPTPTPAPKKLTITVGSNAALDGFESSNGGGNTTVDIRAGRNSNLITRGFVSFKVPSELSGKTVDSATVRLYQGQIIGSPYTAGGSLKVDHLDYGSSLENADYSAASLSSSFATLTTNAGIEWKDVDVKDMLVDDLANGRTYSQYRIHFAVEAVGGDVTGDFAYFESQDNSMHTGNTPQLVITYH